MLEQPEFLSMTLARWQQKRPGLQQFIDVSLDTYARRLDQAQQRNFVRWQILGVRLDWGNPYPMPTYEEQVAFLKTWLKSRIEFLDMAFASPENFHAICR
jgi:hypothetical protein